ncbi:MAG: hypothetical protein [Cressdnaviricota sp.]|nr:MAG: hypothetical protein [Cressdnaviricota sp.]
MDVDPPSDLAIRQAPSRSQMEFARYPPGYAVPRGVRENAFDAAVRRTRGEAAQRRTDLHNARLSNRMERRPLLTWEEAIDENYHEEL